MKCELERAIVSNASGFGHIHTGAVFQSFTWQYLWGQISIRAQRIERRQCSHLDDLQRRLEIQWLEWTRLHLRLREFNPWKMHINVCWCLCLWTTHKVYTIYLQFCFTLRMSLVNVENKFSVSVTGERYQTFMGRSSVYVTYAILVCRQILLKQPW